ncbi:MAG: amino acid-binding protein [Desulfobacteraceae bacterium]|nr:MAG: amino acid-binding protein [Desulfobacteraceae bacterium]
MKIEQLSVFVENKTGRLANIAVNLGEININIKAISLADTSEFGILRLVVSDPQRAKKMLRDRGFTVSLTEVLAVKIMDQPGELGRLLQMMEKNNLNIEYVYGLTESNKNHAVLIFGFDDLDKAMVVLSENNVTLISMEELVSI